MLTRLSVKNLAIVESAEIEFGAGLNILTGETGAGKSVLLRALELVLGARADASSVRDGAKEARIDASFASPPAALAAILEDLGLPPCEDGVLLVRRSLSAAGGGRVYVNDAPATVQTLRTLGRLLVDIHGPNDHQALLEESFQRAILDSYARVSMRTKEKESPAAAYAAAWEKLRLLSAERAAWMGDASDIAEETERLRYCVNELDQAELSPEDETDLPARHAAAAHAAEIVTCANDVTAELSDGEDGSAAAALISAGARLGGLVKFHAPAQAWRDELESLTVRVQELSRTIADSVSRVDADPETLQALDDRLSLIERLKRKYGCPTVDALMELRTARAARLDDLTSRESRLAGLADEISVAEKAVAATGAVLTDLRRAAAERLAKAITKELHGLGFLKAGFGVTLTVRAPDVTGCDAVCFSFAPNPGEPSRPLRDIASTGETARVMLAVKTVVSEHDATPVLVFDEIDSNIGGEVGRAVGERLRAVARYHQVIAITHLPQSAVYGEHHFAVAKTVSGGRTRTAIRLLAGEERVAEISRMLGGSSLTSVVTQHARELLALAQPS